MARSRATAHASCDSEASTFLERHQATPVARRKVRYCFRRYVGSLCLECLGLGSFHQRTPPTLAFSSGSSQRAPSLTSFRSPQFRRYRRFFQIHHLTQSRDCPTVPSRSLAPSTPSNVLRPAHLSLRRVARHSIARLVHPLTSKRLPTVVSGVCPCHDHTFRPDAASYLSLVQESGLRIPRS
ncbi:hypothetical protein FA13DRAFT_1413372 [Coprinellus micaceus]|uniref:Uncharacterized protein n=1 Tax=Coprinellus micaceus TaxID=71717 RepID=A0A4Y7SNJ8_COPMI|nr:hypothetical protein FA13DRAFT_1413372 [Coprinellus micaceus]